MGGHFINVAEILSKKLGTEEENRVADDEMDTDSVVCIDDEENDDTADGGWPISCDGKLALAEHISIVCAFGILV